MSDNVKPCPRDYEQCYLCQSPKPGENILGIKYFKDENRVRKERVKAWKQILSNIYELNQLESPTCMVVDDQSNLKLFEEKSKELSSKYRQTTL